MIACLLPFLAATLRIEALPVPEAGSIAFEAVIPTGQLTAKEYGAATLIAETLPLRTEFYHWDELVSYGGVYGVPLRCTLSGDHFRIRFGVPPGNLRIGFELLRELLDRAKFEPETVALAASKLPFRKRSAWSEALIPLKPDIERLDSVELHQLYRKLFRPEKIVVGISGPFVQADLDSEADRAFGEWQVTNRHRPLLTGATRFVSRHTEALASYEIRSKLLPSKAEDMPSNLLVAAALASGKGSSLFRIARMKVRLSYFQEGFLWPGPDGFRFRMIGLHHPEEGGQVVSLAALKEALIEDVSTWTQLDLERAQGVLDASFRYDVGQCPLRLGVDPTRFDHDGRAYLAAYWRSKFGTRFDLNEISAAAALIDLDELKKQALSLLNDAELIEIPGA